jgi:hypothetical protein
MAATAFPSPAAEKAPAGAASSLNSVRVRAPKMNAEVRGVVVDAALRARKIRSVSVEELRSDRHRPAFLAAAA